jgi:hypothetical protein
MNTLVKVMVVTVRIVRYGLTALILIARRISGLNP